MSELHEAFQKIKNDLDWRGPSGSINGHVVLERRLAQAVFDALEKLNLRSISLDCAPLPWDWEWVSANASGGGHIYLIDANGRKIGAIWGKAEEKKATADVILRAVNGGAVV